MALEPFRIPTLTQSIPFVDKDGRLTNEAHRRLNEIFRTIAQAILDIISAQNTANEAMDWAAIGQTQSAQSDQLRAISASLELLMMTMPAPLAGQRQAIENAELIAWQH